MLTINLSPVAELRTKRLCLRRMLPTDAAALLRLRSDERVMRYFDREPMSTEEQALELIRSIDESIAKNQGVMWGICLPPDESEIVGTIGPWNITAEHYRAELGYLLHPDLWGQGLMGEALDEVCRYAFEDLGLHSLEANVNPNNAASRRLLEKHGFVQEAYFRENFYHNGQFHDSVIYSRLAPR
ncbi:GNAT family N-acetyltransferase [Hymenobacter latericus]|uniref:GNAT family N-acetyltransferase n=1 Tax=Hymenobacter sp. YIM 151858-1 TaxID=2987688 RepID=UPI002226FF3F|nr:GNAT family N-acetyltransferase [Hymenobacter sp. YIM 151858-1]UYZ58837.1 GNAT family N-acetyltransferase [Hymenobacter sp. YIM 151858-1]